MFRRKPSPEMEAIRAVWVEIQAAATERKAAMERLRTVLEQEKEKPEPSLRYARHWGGE